MHVLQLETARGDRNSLVHVQDTGHGVYLEVALGS